MKHLSAVPEEIRTTLRNNVGGHANHAYFWQMIGPNAGGVPIGESDAALRKALGS